MFSSMQGSIWDRIQMKNAELNRPRGHTPAAVPEGPSVSEWDLSQVDLHGDEVENNSRRIPTIELEDDDEEEGLESASVRGEEPLRGFPSAHRIHVVPVQVEPAATSPVMLGDAHSRSLVRRSIHEYRREHAALDESLPGESFPMHSSSATAGIIVNRSYNKPVHPLRENYFSSSILDTPPSPGMLPVASIFGESRPTSTEPRIVMTANHYEKRIVRRSVEKPSSTTVAATTAATQQQPTAPCSSSTTSSRERRREKNNAPYKLLGVIDLEPDSETESIDDTYPDGALACLNKSTVSPSTTGLESFVGRQVLGQVSSSSDAGVGKVTTTTTTTTTNGEKKVLTIEIDEDEEPFDEEDTRMELSEPEEEVSVGGVCEAEKDEEEQCTLSDSDSSTAQVNPSSLANSFWDVSSSGCIKQACGERSGSSKVNKETEFDQLLDRINQQVPAMSQQDRIEHWRVTKEDLLYSIPTVAEIESGKPVKRPMDGPIHISSSESSSDSEASASPSLLAAKQQRASIKKRRTTGEEVAERSSPSLHLSEELDFRRSQINPEIDKSMIQCRKNYHKFPTRFTRVANDEDAHSPQDPYVELMCRKDAESDKFASYLRRNNPAYRPDLKALQHRALKDNKVAVVVLSPLSLQTSSSTETATETSTQPQPERRLSNDRISRYGKERKLRYKVRKPRNKQRAVVVVASNLRSSYRRLIMKQSSLRNGKIRKKASFVNLLTATKKKRAPRPINRLQTQPTAKPPDPPEVIVSRTRARESVDSAVSSSTSAEHKKQQQQQVVTEEHVDPATTSNELRTMKNPLSRTHGEVLAVYYFVDKLIVVQQELVSFWACSKLAALLGLNQELRRIGQCKRVQSDSDVDPTNSQRLGFNENEPFYLEPRARNLDEDDARTCPLASMYVNCYFLADAEEEETTKEDVADDDSGSVVRMKSLQLDSVRSEISDILFMPLPRSRYFMLCWHEQLSESDFRTGLCKYSLTPDLETLASIREFPSVTQKVTGLRCTDDKLIGLGATTIAIWNTGNGCLVFTVDLKMEIQVPLVTYVHTENDESALFLVQLCPSPSGNDNRKLIKVLGINMGKRSWHLVHSYEVALESQSILCESSTLNSASLHCATFASGELLAISLDDLTTCITNHQRLQSRADGRRLTRDCVAAREKIFLHPAEPRQLVLVSEKFIKLKTVDEYLLACR